MATDEPLVETTTEVQAGSTPANTPPPVTATPPKLYTEDEVKAVRETVTREAQSRADKVVARIHQQTQQQLKTRTAAATDVMRQNRVPNADSWEQGIEVYEKARAFDDMTAQQRQWQEWNGYVATSATEAGLRADDPRITGASDALDLQRRVASAIREDERKARENEADRLKDRERKVLEGQAESGNLDTLGGRPAGGPPSAQEKLERAKKELKTVLAQPGRKDLKRIADLQATVRAG